MTTRTPTPWKVVSARYLGATEFAGIANAGVTELVADKLKKADADFVVTACNAHDDLVSALLMLLRGHENLTNGQYEQAQNALKLAGVTL